MARHFLTNIDLNGNQILGLRVEVLAADPTGADLYEGRLWFNSTSNLLKYYDGTTTIELGVAAGGGVDSLTVDDSSIENTGTGADPIIRVKALGITNAMLAGSIALAKLASDPLARANHTGTQLAATISDLAAVVKAYRLDEFADPTSDIPMNGQKFTGLADPTDAQDSATRAYVLAQIAALVDSSPSTLDTLNELAAALGDDANFAATTAASLGALDTRLDALEVGTIPRKYATDVGDNAATAYVITHNLNSRDVVVSVRRSTTPWDEVLCDVEMTSVNTVTLRFAVAPTLNQYRVTVIG